MGVFVVFLYRVGVEKKKPIAVTIILWYFYKEKQLKLEKKKPTSLPPSWTIKLINSIVPWRKCPPGSPVQAYATQTRNTN